MRSFYILSFLICLDFCGACKQDSPAQQEATTTVTTDSNSASTTSSAPAPGSSSTKEKPATANSDPAAAKTAQVDVGQGHDYTFLTHQMFRINGSFIPGKDPKDQVYKDQWVDLEPNGTFKWGKAKDLLYSGLWGYNHDMKILDLKPNDKNAKQTEWKVIFNDDMMVWTGTNTFGNNGIQLQLIRTPQIN